MNVYIDRLQWLLDLLDVRLIAPTHGLPITNPAATVPRIKEGLLYGSSVAEMGPDAGGLTEEESNGSKEETIN